MRFQGKGKCFLFNMGGTTSPHFFLSEESLSCNQKKNETVFISQGLLSTNQVWPNYFLSFVFSSPNISFVLWWQGISYALYTCTSMISLVIVFFGLLRGRTSVFCIFFVILKLWLKSGDHLATFFFFCFPLVNLVDFSLALMLSRVGS